MKRGEKCLPWRMPKALSCIHSSGQVLILCTLHNSLVMVMYAQISAIKTSDKLGSLTGKAGTWRTQFSPVLNTQVDAWIQRNLKVYNFDSDPFQQWYRSVTEPKADAWDKIFLPMTSHLLYIDSNYSRLNVHFSWMPIIILIKHGTLKQYEGHAGAGYVVWWFFRSWTILHNFLLFACWNLQKFGSRFLFECKTRFTLMLALVIGGTWRVVPKG